MKNRVEGLGQSGYNGRAVNAEASSPLETIICGRCATACEAEDNFCRHCGMALQDRPLPSVRQAAPLPAVWRPRVPGAVVRGAAFVAAGTIAEALVRRMVRRALGRTAGARAPAARSRRAAVVRPEPMPDDAQVVSDTVLFRRVRIRR